MVDIEITETTDKVEVKKTKVLATGKRKTSVARVHLKDGSGKIVINGKDLDEYFPRMLYRQQITAPLEATGSLKKFDVKAKVEGGGLTGQAGAVGLGVARALVLYDESNRGPLRDKSLLTRDPRMVERKKYGLRKARRAPQYSKR
ncbi:MAG: 30S ribosomal protein S9 [Candidatus Kaelpia aquatica]|nr:30S ribosomal protein S9 [Candidatus Kaelpia aquatica]